MHACRHCNQEYDLHTSEKIHRMINTSEESSRRSCMQFIATWFLQWQLKGWRLWILHIDLHICTKHTVQQFPQMIWARVSASSPLRVFTSGVVARVLVCSRYAVYLEVSPLPYIHKLKEYFESECGVRMPQHSVSHNWEEFIQAVADKLEHDICMRPFNKWNLVHSIADYGGCKHVNALATGLSWLECCDSSGRMFSSQTLSLF